MWVDKTSYSYAMAIQDRVPKTWEQKSGGLLVVVTRYIHGAPDEWFLTCHALGIEQKSLGRCLLDVAKLSAINVVRNKAAQHVTWANDLEL